MFIKNVYDQANQLIGENINHNPVLLFGKDENHYVNNKINH